MAVYPLTFSCGTANRSVGKRSLMSSCGLGRKPRPGQPLLIEPLRSRAPTEAWSHLVAARWSDADVLQHVNQSNYLAYFEDVRWLGAQAGAYGQHSALAQRECAKAAIDYRRQVLVGDQLQVATWVLDDDPLRLGLHWVLLGLADVSRN